MSDASTIFTYTDQPYSIPQCSVDAPARFWAHSLSASHSPIYGAPFCTGDDRFFTERGIPMFFGARGWLYYPIEFSRALLAVGVHNEVECHSGRTVRDGEYID